MDLDLASGTAGAAAAGTTTEKNLGRIPCRVPRAARSPPAQRNISGRSSVEFQGKPGFPKLFTCFAARVTGPASHLGFSEFVYNVSRRP